MSLATPPDQLMFPDHSIQVALATSSTPTLTTQPWMSSKVKKTIIVDEMESTPMA